MPNTGNFLSDDQTEVSKKYANVKRRNIHEVLQVSIHAQNSAQEVRPNVNYV